MNIIYHHGIVRCVVEILNSNGGVIKANGGCEKKIIFGWFLEWKRQEVKCLFLPFFFACFYKLRITFPNRRMPSSISCSLEQEKLRRQVFTSVLLM